MAPQNSLATSWDKLLAEHTESQLLWSISEGYLNYDEIPLHFHTIDRTILLLSSIILKHNKKLSILYPINKCNLIAPIAAEILYEIIFHKSRNKVLVISNNTAKRNDFLSLKANQMVLHQNVFPVGIVHSDGSISKVTKKYKKQRANIETKLFFSASPQILPENKVADQIKCVIVDSSEKHTNSNYDYLLTWCEENGIESVLFIETKPYSSHIDFYNNRGIPLWGWDDESLKIDYYLDMADSNCKSRYANPFGTSYDEIKNRVEGVKKVYIDVEDETLNSLLISARKIYSELRKNNQKKNDSLIGRAIIDYLVTIYSLERLCVPLNYAEYEFSFTFPFKTIENRIELLEDYESIISQKDQILGSFWSNTHIICRKIQTCLEASSPKTDMIIKIIEESILEDKSLLLIMYNEASKRALDKFLLEKYNFTKDKMEASNVNIISIKELSEVGCYDIAIFCGQVPFSRLELVRTANASKLGFVVYESEKEMLKLQIKKDKLLFERLFNPDLRVKTCSKLTNIPEESIRKAIPIIAHKRKSNAGIGIEKEKVSVEFTPELDSIFKDFSVPELNLDTSNLDHDSKLLYEKEENTGISNEGSLICGIKFVMDDGFVLYSKRSKDIAVFHPNALNKKLEYKLAKKIKEKDILVLINKENVQSITEMVLDVIDEHPSMKNIIFLVKYWVRVLQKGMKENNDALNDLLIKLKDNGSRITSEAAIYFWTRGYVIGPNDKEDIKRIGIIYNDEFLTKNYTAVATAITRLRGIHSRLLRKLSKMIPQAGVEAQNTDSCDELIDEDLNLYIEDFVGMISFHKVNKIERDVSVEYSKLNKLIKM